MDTSNSGANQAVLHAQSDRWNLGPLEICNSDSKTLFCRQKPQMRAGTHREVQFWC